MLLFFVFSIVESSILNLNSHLESQVSFKNPGSSKEALLMLASEDFSMLCYNAFH
jgi:hypothetical protein